MVKKVAWGMQELIIQDWYLNDQDRSNKLLFTEYLNLKEVREYWLPTDWEDTVHQKMLSSMQGNRPFHDWAIEIQSKNTLLRDTDSYFTDVYLKYHLESHMNPHLATDYHDERITEHDLHKWINKVKVLDNKHLHNVAQHKEAADAVWQAGQGKSTTDKKLSSTTHFSKARKTTTTDTSSSKTFVRLPSLTDTERQLLRDDDGCFKCCEPFAGHTSANCPAGFPDGTSYKTLTAATISAKRPRNKTLSPQSKLKENKLWQL